MKKIHASVLYEGSPMKGPICGATFKKVNKNLKFFFLKPWAC